MATHTISAVSTFSVVASATAQVTYPRIKKISVSGYRAFPPYRPTSLELDLGDSGRNLLLYGENGSGKTSLFRALRDLCDTSQRTRDYQQVRNLFLQENDDSIAIELTQGTPSEYRWEVGENHPKVDGGDSFRAFANSCLFLDYRDLLETNFMHRTGSPNLFLLLVRSILAELRAPSTTLRRYYEGLIVNKPSRHTNRQLNQVFTACRSLQNALINHLPEVVRETNRILERLQRGTVIDLVPPTHLHYDSDERNFAGLNVSLTATFNSKPITEPQHFLNEARLTAIALAIYFAGARITRSGRPGIMVLDDVLIGLDLSNRIPLLQLLREEFADWQIFLLTHDHTWFELAREYTEHDHAWTHREMHLIETPAGQPDLPEIKDSVPPLKRANAHLRANDKMAAAVYLRAAFEARLRNICENKGIEVPFKKYLKEVKADALWNGIVKRQEQREALQTNEPARNHPDFISRALIERVEMMRSTILNKLSHTDSPTFEKSEIETARDIITEFQNHPFPSKSN